MKKTFFILYLALICCSMGFCQSMSTTTETNNTASKTTIENVNDVNSVSAATEQTIVLDDMKTDKEAKSENNKGKTNEVALMILTVLLGLLALLAPAIVSGIQQQIRLSQEFQSCSKSLYSENPIEQASAAILLRSFLKKRRVGLFFRIDYTREAKNLIVALLRTNIPTILQKNLADGLSHADSLEGQDLQFVNMIGALIKPKSRIQYEIYKDEKYKKKRLSMKNADMFHAVIQGCSINNVDATEAVFLYSMLCGTSFRNCILINANFRSSNVSNARFDSDCKLEGAVFEDAIGINTAVVKCKGTNVPLIDFLDSGGKFCSEKPQVKYKPSRNTLKVFISKLGVMDSQQNLQYESLKGVIGKLDEIEFVTIERDEYLPASQLVDVSTHMAKCDGCVIFAYGYLDVHSGTIHKNLIGNDKLIVENKVFASPWLHIETALANGKQMPCLIIYDRNLYRDGMFDEAIVESNNNILALPYSDDISPQNQILLDWKGKVIEYHKNNNSR